MLIGRIKIKVFPEVFHHTLDICIGSPCQNIVVSLFDLLNSVDGIPVAECQKCIISPILNFIRGDKFYRFKVRGFLLYLCTEWYHPVFGVCRAVSMTEYRTCK